MEEQRVGEKGLKRWKKKDTIGELVTFPARTLGKQRQAGGILEREEEASVGTPGRELPTVRQARQ